MSAVAFMTARELVDAYRRRTLSPVDVTAAVVAHAKALNGRINAFIDIREEEALRQAHEAERDIAAGRVRGPLHGVPVSIKDNIDQQGVPTTAASRVRAGHIAAADATVVRRLKAAGAVLIGKCNLHEFAAGITSAVSAAGPVRNPWDLARSAGGSSGGSAAAVAAGLGVASIGTDTGGSIRIPAGACGIVGLKPTFGRVPRDGIVPLSWSLDHVGPLARTVQDAATVLGVIAGADRRDTSTRAHARPTLRPLQPAVLRGRRIGILTGRPLDDADPEVRGRVEDALRALEKDGARLVEVTVPHAAEVAAVYTLISRPERTSYHEHDLARHPNEYHPSIRNAIEIGAFVLAVDYLRAQRVRSILLAEVESALEGLDAIALPNSLAPAPLLDPPPPAANESTPRPPGDAPTRNLWLFNLTGHPVLALPCGFTARGLPVGFQLVGHQWGERLLCRIGLSCERALAVGSRRPPVGADA